MFRACPQKCCLSAEVTPADIARAWSVEDVVSFFRQRDAAGVATTVERNAVNGEDLLGFATAADIARDLQLPPFAARKVIRLRDAFLREGAPMP